jgi:hypothetical protein
MKHDRDSTHIGRKVMEYLEENSPGGYKGIFGVIAQPA